MIAAGNLNRRISLQCQSIAQDDFGQPLTTWTTYLTTWANMDIQNSQLKFATAEFVSKVTYRITIRYPYVPVAAKYRIVYCDTMGEHVYEINAVLNTKQANKELVLLAYELEGVQ
jgi:SPP1 family predicted phage head-tail adaptor